MQTPSLSAEQRRRAVELAIKLTTGTTLEPQRYERRLLTRFELGELTLDQVSERMEAAVYQIIYHSQATIIIDGPALQSILDWSRDYNAQHQITGLLLYSDGRFVQLIEGSEAEVKYLYANIRKDTRHTNVLTISEGPGPQLYAEWTMALGHVTALEIEHALIALQLQKPETAAFVFAPLSKLLQLFN